MDFFLFFSLGDAMVYFYTFAFFFCLARRGFDSASLALISLVPLELFMRDVRDPLIQFVTVHHNYSYYIWFPFWMLCDLLYIMVLNVLHRVLQLQKSKLYVMISTTFFAFIVLQFAAMVDSITFKFQWFTTLYTYAIPSLNVCIFLYSVYYVVRYGSRNKDNDICL